MERKQRISITDLMVHLIRDPVYGHSERAQELAAQMISELGNDQPFQLYNYPEYDPHLYLIQVWCGLGGLNTYKPGEKEPLEWLDADFTEMYRPDLKIDRDDLKRFLRERRWPLPAVWFPDEPDNTERQADVSTGPPARKRRRRYSKQYEQAREIAQKIWEEKPDRTITWIIRHRLRKRVLKPDRRPFSDKAYRGWIQNLRPRYRGKNTPHN